MRTKTVKASHPPSHCLFSPFLTHSIYFLWHGSWTAYSAYSTSLDQTFVYAYSMNLEQNLPLLNCPYLLSLEIFPFADSAR